ncbi:site-2 protease family protein [Candidatus Woesearchaeota archaeon]|nr:site-2 protease family protein [Candidatus Woesearchaeota archaeon]
MNFEYVLLTLFIVLLSVLLYFERKKLQINKFLFPLFYFVMYRTRLGLDWMDRTAKKYPRILDNTFKLGIVVGILGMIMISYELIQVTYLVFTSTQKVQAITPVLPFEAKGIFYVPFSYWIISIFIIALVHEFAHGVAARVYKIPVKSSGFAVLGILLPIVPAAFVEPDETKVPKAKLSHQLGIFAAGPFSNIIFAIIFAIITLLVFQPLHSTITEQDGVIIDKVLVNTSASTYLLQEKEIIKSINDKEITTVESFVQTLDALKPNQEIKINTNEKTYNLVLGQHSENPEKPFLGIVPAQHFNPKINNVLYLIIKWFIGLFLILYLLNLGIGLFNLLPLGPLDGGRMLHAILHNYLPEGIAIKIFAGTSAFFLFLIGFHLINAFLG